MWLVAYLCQCLRVGRLPVASILGVRCSSGLGMWPSAPSGGLRQRLVVLRLLPVLPVSVHCRLLVVSMLEVRWSSGLGTWPSATSGRLRQCIAVFSALGGLRRQLVVFRASLV